jgi:oligosaccharyltransferase complex subunit alpha (ribophorin I)
MQQATTHVLSRFPMALPPGARDPYFIDQIGNVSTSRFHSSPPAPDSINTPPHLLPKGYASAIEIQPRYPVLGGWNYTFSLGWNHKLGKGGWGKSLSGGANSVAVPFLTAVGDAFAIDNVKTTIVLPEGAT